MYTFLLIVVFFIQFLLLLALVFLITTLGFGLAGVPWVPTRSKIGKKMFELAELKPGEIVVDFGCGDGALLFTAVKDFKAAKGIGYEIHPALRWIGQLRAKFKGISDKIDLRGGNFFKIELPKADVIATYLFPETQVKLEPLLKKYYPSGTRVISRTFKYPTLPLIKTDVVQGETLYLYLIP